MESTNTSENESAIHAAQVASGSSFPESAGLFLGIASTCSVIFACCLAYEIHEMVWADIPVLVWLFFIPTVLLFLASITAAVLCLIGVLMKRHLDKAKPAWPIVVLIATSLALLLPFAEWGGDALAYNTYYSYTAEKWLASSPEDRSRMWPYFEKEHNLIGENKDAVVAYLGEPSTGKETSEWIYEFGFVGWSIDPTRLSISFGTDEKVSKYSTYSD